MISRRRFHGSATAAALAACAQVANAEIDPSRGSHRPRVGCVGLGQRGRMLAVGACRYGDVVALCDVDERRSHGSRSLLSGMGSVCTDYRVLLDRSDMDAVIIATRTDTHAEFAIAAMQAGKDVYCETPLAHCVNASDAICQVAQQSGRIVQVGTQQRSEMGRRFLLAAALVQAGRLGNVARVTCSIGHLSQATFLDRAVHHVDVALWAVGSQSDNRVGAIADMSRSAAEGISQVSVDMGRCEIVIRSQMAASEVAGGILFEGDRGTLLVNRGNIEGAAVEQLRDNPLSDDMLRRTYKGFEPTSHMGNFFDCVAAREQPVSDVWSHHRALTVCHLAWSALYAGNLV